MRRTRRHFISSSRWVFPKARGWSCGSSSDGQQHTLGRVRFSVASDQPPRAIIAEQRREAIDQAFAQWLEHERTHSAHWTTLHPVEAKSGLPLLTVGDDGVVFVSGDMSKSDTYELKFRSDLRGITAVRLEVLADERLPKHGPGRIFYEGPPGDFMLSNIELLSGGAEAAVGTRDAQLREGEIRGGQSD